MVDIKKVLFDSENFNLFELTEGVYAAIEIGKSCGSNAGFIDLGDRTVIFDTFLNIDASKELKKASELLTGKKASIVINSHSHSDHIIGNCLFDEAVLISSPETRTAIETIKKEFDEEKDEYGKRIEEIEKLFETETDEGTISNLKNEYKFLSNFTKPGVDIRVPDASIDGETVLYGSKRTIKLMKYDKAHSSGDLVAYIPEEKICFTGDLLFSSSHPWIGSGNPEGLIEALEALSSLDIEHFVPGHGRLATKEDITLQIKYVKEMIQLVEDNQTLDVGEFTLDMLSPEFQNLESLCFSWNLQFLLDRKK
ncbi:MAG TPA: MBL fold metallo-hydrolase [Thermotogota bacterium]|nr:MBL fold metallo-hydrolase [Thermotogota bacterium]HPJ90044.1 MBL fold metallo-hydrolase [Thermotogota bacterium]